MFQRGPLANDDDNRGIYVARLVRNSHVLLQQPNVNIELQTLMFLWFNKKELIEAYRITSERERDKFSSSFLRPISSVLFCVPFIATRKMLEMSILTSNALIQWLHLFAEQILVHVPALSDLFSFC